jgi:DNA-binding response OmpR family regulator
MAGRGDRLCGVRLLLIEDSRTLRQAIRDLLEMEGATVIEAGTGREALELVRAQLFDLVLTDLGLPDMTGGQIVPQIRALMPGRTPIAVLSGAGTEQLAAALRAGADWAFAKPVEWDDLVRCLTCPAADGAGHRAVGPRDSRADQGWRREISRPRERRASATLSSRASQPRPIKSS